MFKNWRDTRKTELAGIVAVGAEVGLPVRVEATAPTRSQQQQAPTQLSVRPLPVLHVRHAHFVLHKKASISSSFRLNDSGALYIPVGLGLVANVEDASLTDEGGEGELGDGESSRGEVRRRVQMRPRVLGERKVVGAAEGVVFPQSGWA